MISGGVGVDSFARGARLYEPAGDRFARDRSPAARGSENTSSDGGDASTRRTDGTASRSPAAREPDATRPPSPGELTPEEREQVRALQARDLEVRAHEAAHMAAGGSLSGGASYDFVVGPDGRMYAVGGEVPVRMPQGGSPEEAIRNAQQVRAAALAPANPSAQDRAVAASAAAMEMEARRALAEEGTAEAREQRAAGSPGRATEAGPAGENVEGADVARALETERRQMYGTLGHGHFGSSCGMCSAMANRYRWAV